MYCTKVPNLPPHNFEVNWGPPSTVAGGGVGMRSFLQSFSKRCHRVVESFWPFTPFASLLSVATHSYYLHLLDSVWWELVKGFLFSTSLSAMCLYPSLTYFTSFSSRWRSLPFAAAATNVWAYLGKSRSAGILHRHYYVCPWKGKVLPCGAKKEAQWGRRHPCNNIYHCLLYYIFLQNSRKLCGNNF